MAAKEEPNVEENYYNWKANTPYLYDCIISHGSTWPSLTVQWFPYNKSSQYQKLLLGTNTSGAEQDYLILATIPFGMMTGEQDIGDDEMAIEIAEQFPHQGEINKARYMPQNPDIVATQAAKGEIRIYSLSDPKKTPFYVLIHHKMDGYGLSWNELVSGRLLTCSNDASICLWDINSKSMVADFLSHKGGVQDISWAWKDANLFCSTGEDSKALLWDARNSTKPCGSLEGHKECVNCVDFNKVNEYVVALGSADATISIWDLRSTDYKQCSLEKHDDEVITLSWDPHKENLLCSGDKDGKVMIWDLQRLGEEISKEDEKDGSPELIFTHGGHKASIADLQWNQDAELVLASVDQQNVLQIWKMDRNIYEEKTEDPEMIKDNEVE